jgi:hypothetical protein
MLKHSQIQCQAKNERGCRQACLPLRPLQGKLIPERRLEGARPREGGKGGAAAGAGDYPESGGSPGLASAAACFSTRVSGIEKDPRSRNTRYLSQ